MYLLSLQVVLSHRHELRMASGWRTFAQTEHVNAVNSLPKEQVGQERPFTRWPCVSGALPTLEVASCVTGGDFFDCCSDLIVEEGFFSSSITDRSGDLNAVSGIEFNLALLNDEW